MKGQRDVLKKMGNGLTKLEEAKLKKVAHVEILNDKEVEGWDERDKADYERNKQFEKLTGENVVISNTMIDATLRDLETTKQGVGETLSKYMTRWKGKASMMVNRLNEKDQINMIIKNLLPTYNSRHLSLPISSFEELCGYGDRKSVV